LLDELKPEGVRNFRIKFSDFISALYPEFCQEIMVKGWEEKIRNQAREIIEEFKVNIE
jgi:hypothetical protein